MQFLNTNTLHTKNFLSGIDILLRKFVHLRSVPKLMPFTLMLDPLCSIFVIRMFDGTPKRRDHVFNTYNLIPTTFVFVIDVVYVLSGSEYFRYSRSLLKKYQQQWLDGLGDLAGEEFHATSACMFQQIICDNHDLSRFVLVFVDAAKHQVRIPLELNGYFSTRFIDVFPKDLSMTTTTTSGVPHRFGSWSDTRVSYNIVVFRGDAPVSFVKKRSMSEELGSTYDTIRDMISLRIGRVKLRRVRAMFMTIQSSVKDKILATLSETSKVENAPAEMLCKTNVVIDALRRKERVKPRRVRAMAMTIRYGVRGMMLAAQSEAFKQENGMMRTVVMDEAHASSERMSQTLEDMLRACVIDFGGSWDVHLPLAEFSYNNSYRSSIRCAPFEALYGRKCRSPVLWAEVGESSLIGPELVQETTDKVVLIKEKFKAVRDRQKSYADNSRKPLEFEVGNRELLKVTPWKGVVRKKCLADASLHVPLDEIKVDKTLHFVKEPVEISDREVKRLKCSRMVVVKGSLGVLVKVGSKSSRLFKNVGVHCNFKHGSEFTWERKDYKKSKYPQLFVGRADESAS
ncbi:putative reverse transcriptase domain-containing protein [Tanacetum coccineum]